MHFLPKFHPELNPIEKLWCFSKRPIREAALQRAAQIATRHSSGITTANFLNEVNKAIDGVSKEHLARCFNSVRQKELAYYNGLTVQEVLAKKYKSHRRG